MSLRKKLTGAGLMLGLILATSAAVFAQQPSNAPQDNGQQQEGQWGRGRGGGGRHGMGRKGGGGGMLRLMNQLNLTDAQRQQLRAIEDRFESSTKAQREEMRRLHESSQGEPSADAQARAQALRAELGQAMRARHQEVLGILTQEQRTQLEQMKNERKARHEERRGGRGMNRQNNDDDQ